MLFRSGGQYVPYTNIQAFFNGPVRVQVSNGKVAIKPDASGQLALNGQFYPDYVQKYRPEGSINWSRIAPEAQKALLEQGWTFSLPTWSVNPRVWLRSKDGDLIGPNFRLGFEVIRK